MQCMACSDRKHFKTGLHTDTGYPVQTPSLYLINIFKYKRYVVFFKKIYLSSINCRVGTGNPVLPSQPSCYTLHEYLMIALYTEKG